MSTDPVIEVIALDILAYKEDRATVICRPHLVLMLNPICGCVLNKIIEATGSRSDALAGALSSWRLGSGTKKFIIDDGRDFLSTTLVSVTLGAGYKVQYGARKLNGIVERALMRLTQRMRHWQVGKEDSTHLTLAEIQRRVEIRVAIHNERIRKIRKVRRAGSVYKVAGTGISLSVRRALLHSAEYLIGMRIRRRAGKFYLANRKLCIFCLPAPNDVRGNCGQVSL